MRAWWGGLGARERRVVLAGSAVVAAIVVFFALWEPAADGIRRLNAELPNLRAQDASLRAMAQEAARLRSAGGSVTPVAPDDRVGAVRRALDRAGLARGTAPVAEARGAVTTLSSQGIVVSAGPTTAAAAPTSAPEVTGEPGGRVRVRFDNIDYGVWVGWLAATESELSARAVRVTVASLAPNGPIGRVKTDALFDWTAPAPASGGSVAAR